MREIVTMRLGDHVGMNRVVPLEEEDPRRISSTLAKIPPPPTEQIAEEQKSRFKKEDPDATILYYPHDPSASTSSS